MLLRLEDDRVLRQRSNLRALRRTILRLTNQLPTARRTVNQALFHRLFVSDDAATMARTMDETMLGVSTAAAAAATTTTMIKDIAVGESPYDLPITRYLTVTRDWLLALGEKMLRDGYSLTYIRNALSVIRSDSRPRFPLNHQEFATFVRSIVQTKRKHFSDCRIRSDGVYATSEATYTAMLDFVRRYLTAVASGRRGVQIVADGVAGGGGGGGGGLRYQETNNYSHKWLIFCYLYGMMYYTGKRVSDLCTLSVDDLRRLAVDGSIAVRIPKTEKIGRISMHRGEEFEEFREFVALLLSALAERNVLPFDQYRVRRSLNRSFKRLYEDVNPGERKPNGLSFHSLRRRKAANYFRQGVDLETIRECLDHANTSMTNVYINKFLLGNG